MRKKTKFTLALAALAIFGVSPLWAQSQQQQQQAPPPAQQTQKPSLANPSSDTSKTAAVPVDPKEEAAYKAFYDAKPATKTALDSHIQEGEKFLKTYPTSRYLEGVYSRLTHDYYAEGNIDKMYEDGQKAISLNDKDVSVLALLGSVIPRTDAQAPDFNTKLAQAIQYDKQALQVIPTLAKPPTVTDLQFTQMKSEAGAAAHSGLGVAYFRQQKFADSATELQQAVNGNPTPDPTDYFVLGLDLQSEQKFADAEQAFDSCAKMSSSLQDRCKQFATAAKAKAGAQPPKP